MSYPFHGFVSVGRNESNTVSTTGAKAFQTVAATRRSNVLITNHDSTNSLYVYLVNRNSAAPTISGVSNNGVIGPGGNLNVPVDLGVEIYVQATGGTVAFNAVEMSF